MAPPRNKPAPCPECGGPTVLEGRFCKGCGWDADLVGTEDSYFDGLDLPQGYGPDEEPVRDRMHPLWVVLALLALAGFVMTSVL